MPVPTRKKKGKNILDCVPPTAEVPLGWVTSGGIWKINVSPSEPTTPEEGEEGEEEENDPNLHLNIFRSLFLMRITLRVMGTIPMKYNKETGNYEFRWLTFSAMHTCVIFAWFNILLVTTGIGLGRLFTECDFLGKSTSHEIELLTVIIIVGCLLNAWVEVFYLLYHRNSFCSYLGEWQAIARRTGLNPAKGLRRSTSILAIFLYTFIVLVLIASAFGGDTLVGVEDALAKVFLLIPEDWLKSDLFCITVLRLMVGILIGHLYVVYKGALFVFVTACHVLYNVFHQWKEELNKTMDFIWRMDKRESAVCSAITATVAAAIGVEVGENNHQASEDHCVGMAELVENHWTIVKMVRFTEKLFAPTLQCFYSTQVVTLCLELYLVAYRMSLGEQYQAEELAWQTIIIAQTFIVFFLVSIKASYVYEEASSSVDVLRRGLPYSASDKDKFHFKELVTSVTGSPICITGGGFFYINRPFIITVIGAVLSYFIIILQLMLPSVQDRAQSESRVNNMSLPNA
ncbi:LOW QUALITY PROTEIN: uncharacterized protein Orco [Macrobrachium rosenbergii]|uniref:LOW QUALITY PROTEIN: uncharacterized protein Orco n=1 Tax=Macrobrachium rosenbergii TaxID=79674 RepID=UPI0034D5D439